MTVPANSFADAQREIWRLRASRDSTLGWSPRLRQWFGYFESAQIITAITHLHAYLSQGGCLVVSRNVDGPAGEVENGSVWLKQADRFERVADFGNGSEVKAIVDNWREGRHF